MNKPKAIAITAKNVTLYAKVHTALEDSLEELVAMLNEDDYPVEFSHQSGFRKTFWSPEEAENYVSELRTELARYSKTG